MKTKKIIMVELVETNVFEAAEIDNRLAATAAARERHAVYLRSLVGRLRVPTYATWKARIKRVEASRPWRLEAHARN